MALPTKLENEHDTGQSAPTQLSLRHIGQEHGFLSSYDVYALYCGDDLVETTDAAKSFEQIPQTLRQDIFLSSEVEQARPVACGDSSVPRYNCLLKVLSVITDKAPLIPIKRPCGK